MKYHTLGNTGLLVSELCLGTMTFANAEGGVWKFVAGVPQPQLKIFQFRLEQDITNCGIGFAVESKGLHSSAWRVGQAGDAF